MASKDVEFIKEPTVNIMSPCCLSLINIIIIFFFSLFFTIELIVKFIMQFFNKAMEGSSDVYLTLCRSHIWCRLLWAGVWTLTSKRNLCDLIIIIIIIDCQKMLLNLEAHLNFLTPRMCDLLPDVIVWFRAYCAASSSCSSEYGAGRRNCFFSPTTLKCVLKTLFRCSGSGSVSTLSLFCQVDACSTERCILQQGMSLHAKCAKSTSMWDISWEFQ